MLTLGDNATFLLSLQSTEKTFTSVAPLCTRDGLTSPPPHPLQFPTEAYFLYFSPTHPYPGVHPGPPHLSLLNKDNHNMPPPSRHLPPRGQERAPRSAGLSDPDPGSATLRSHPPAA